LLQLGRNSQSLFRASTTDKNPRGNRLLEPKLQPQGGQCMRGRDLLLRVPIFLRDAWKTLPGGTGWS